MRSIGARREVGRSIDVSNIFFLPSCISNLNFFDV